MLEKPAPRVKSPELQARLSKLQQQLDKRRYDQMTADVTTQVSLVYSSGCASRHFNLVVLQLCDVCPAGAGAESQRPS